MNKVTSIAVFRRAAGFLASGEALVWITGLWLFYYITLIIWDREAFSYYITALQSKRSMQIPYLLFLGCSYLNLVRIMYGRRAAGLVAVLRKIIFPLGLVILFTGAFVSLTGRQFRWINALPGDLIKPEENSGEYRIVSVDPGVQDRLLDTDMEGAAGLFKYEPNVVISDRNSAVYHVGAFPPSRVDSYLFHVLNFGMAPHITISDDRGGMAGEYVPLRLFAPGSSDSFEIQPLPYKFLVSLEPDRVIEKGRARAAEYAMRDPLYRIRVLEGENVIAEAVTRETLRFRSMRLDVGKPVFWVQLEVVRDKGVYIFLAGLFIACIGLPLFALDAVMSLRWRRVQ